ncbi:MAG TPA: right-handed parallel beta-helix repeat-containing protein [Candidatus Saccharimonadales bacterium]|nr:right-handed parallel beta-helix repeat-containing protein [Candidatus Saccharimonadales bacterium]
MVKSLPITARDFFTLVLLALGLSGQAAFGASAIATTTVALSAKASGADIQKALDGLPPNGEVVLSAGRYEILQPLLLRHDFESLRGSGPSTILHLANGANCPVVILGPPLPEPKHPVAHLRLADLLIDGNRKNQKWQHWETAADGSRFNNNGVEIWNATDVTVEHVICGHCRSGGLITAKVRRLRVIDFEAYDNKFDGLACYVTEESHFEGLRLHDNVAAGISLDLAFNHNLITNGMLMGNDLGVFMRYSRENAFKNLTVSRSHHDGVFMAQADTPTTNGWQLLAGTQCVSNIFENLTITDCGGHAFKVNDASCTNNLISGAHFLRNIQGGLSQPAGNPVVLREVIEREPLKKSISN